MKLKFKNLAAAADKRKLLAALLTAFAALMILSFGLLKSTDISGDFKPYTDGDLSYPSAFYHYTGFFEEPDVFLQLSWKNYNLKLEGETAQTQIMPRILPITLEDKRVEYSSSDESIAKVNENGNITAYKPGTVMIGITLLSTGQTEYAQLNVIRPVTGVILKSSSINVNISDAFIRMEAQVYPSDASNKSLKWEVKDESVAQIDDNGTLKPMSVGMTEITVTTEDGGFSAKGFVNVINKIINPETVQIQNKGSAKMSVGESINMIATISPANSRNKTVTWSSSDSRIATVSKTGRVKAIEPGITTISVRTSNGKMDTMELVVDASSTQNILDLSDKVTSDQEIPTDILGTTYIKNNSVTNGVITYTSYDITLSDIADIQMSLNPPPKIWRSGGTVYATKAETEEYMNPQNYYTGAYKYQFLDLSSSNGVTADELNKFLEGKGILEGMGQAFVDAAKEYNLSEVYLVAHACLETGNGTSQLATGVNVNGTTVYNMFGIAAYDSSALYSGSRKAYSEGWTTPESAIKGGAQWISQWYINASNSRQNTLYKMLWNPENPGQHQYATDISWAVKQAVSIEQIFESFPNASLSYDIPVYQGQTAITLE